MVKCLACDFGERNITVNCVAPGGIRTDMAADNTRHYLPSNLKLSPEEVEAKIAAMSPLNRFGVPEDVAGVVAFLASPDAQWLTGQTIHVGGGVHMATA
jgi:NAD(P)-dependent dehydrogenase (short-subunit alcohol dehydrogenase family)